MMQEASSRKRAPFRKAAPSSSSASHRGAAVDTAAAASPDPPWGRLTGTLLAASFLVGLAVLQPPRGDALAPQPSWASLEGFLAPREENRWRRAAAPAPVFASIAASGGLAAVANTDGSLVLLSEDGGRLWRVAAPAELPADLRRKLQAPPRQKAAAAPQIVPHFVPTGLQLAQPPSAKQAAPEQKGFTAKDFVQQRPLVPNAAAVPNATTVPAVPTVTTVPDPQTVLPPVPDAPTVTVPTVSVPLPTPTLPTVTLPVEKPNVSLP
jgi:hypothetical protein